MVSAGILYSVHFITVFLLVTPSLSEASGVYREIYPQLMENDSLSLQHYYDRDCTAENKCPLFFSFLISFGGIYKSNGGLPGVQIALDEINRDESILPGYTLHYTLHDSNCSREVALASFFTQMIQPPIKLGVIGSGCSVSTEATAEIASYFNLTQTSCVSSSPLLSNRPQFKTYFQLLASESFIAYGYFTIVRQFGWTRVAIITQEEALFTYVMDLVTKQLRVANVSYTEVKFLTADGVNSLEDRLFAYQAGIYYPRYQFVIVGWYGDLWWVGDDSTQEYLLSNYGCTLSNREVALQYSLSVVQDEFATNDSLVIDSGNTAEQFYKSYNSILETTHHDISSFTSIYGQQCYDATWSLARALNKTMTALKENATLRTVAHQHNSDLDADKAFSLHHFTYNNTVILDSVFENMQNTDFVGITGQIRFDKNGVKKNKYITVHQYKPTNGSLAAVPVAQVDLSNTSDLIFIYADGINDTNLWPHGEIPYDGVPNLVQATVKVGITVLYAILATGGLIFTAVCLVFNFVFRNTKLMKLSSPNLNYFILTGAIIIYIAIFFFIIPTTDQSAITFFCNLTPWLSALGYSLCFGTIVMKMGRIFYIFRNSMSTAVKRTIHDWMLGTGVVILIIIDVVILTVFMIVDRRNLLVIVVESSENSQDLTGVLGIITNYYISICDSTERTITIAILYGYKALLQIVALIFAFSVRKVNIKGLDDSPFIIAAIYVSSIVLAVILVSSITLKDFENTFAGVYCTGFFIGTTVILLLVFVPKMVTLYRDPKGERIFKSIAPPSEVVTDTATHKEKKLSRRLSRGEIRSPNSDTLDQTVANGAGGFTPTRLDATIPEYSATLNGTDKH